MAQEIEEELERLERSGSKITKLSVVGYSLGGLIARYCIGLLYSRGWFSRLQPINFTAFASPFLGVRTPLRGYHSSMWNALGARTLSTSGRQLFLIDQFRDTGRPLLSILADPDSIFMQALAQFKNRVLYANVTNDRSAPYYTTGISRTDPFEDLDAVDMNFIKGYERVVANPDNPVAPKNDELSFYRRVLQGSSSLLTRIPLYALFVVVVPIGTTAFLINAGIQSFKSSQRIKLHNDGSTGAGFGAYRIPLMVEGAIESMNAREPQEHLRGPGGDATRAPSRRSTTNSEKAIVGSGSSLARPRSSTEFPTLALAREQFEMIENLDKVGFRKYPVLITLARHSHAAIIVRMKRESFKEGYVVIRHWLDEEFEI